MKTLVRIAAAASLAALFSVSPAAAQMPGEAPWIQPVAAYGYADEAAAAPAEGAEGGVCPNDLCGCNCDGKWIGTVDIIAFNRYPGQRQVVVSDRAGQPLVTLNDMNFDYEMAPRASLIRKDVYCGWDLEFGYFGIDNWSYQATVPNSTFASQTFPMVTAVAPQAIDIHYDARMYNFELNLRKQIDCTWTFISGFRWIELQEGFSGQRVGGAPEMVFWHSQTMNHLYGLQLGAERLLWAGQCGRFRLDGLVKAGGYSNHATQRSASPGVNVNEVSASNDALAFVGEAGLTASYQLSCHWAVRGGWQGMWMESLALAPTQYPMSNVYNSTAGIDTRGGVFVQGGFFGLEANY